MPVPLALLRCSLSSSSVVRSSSSSSSESESELVVEETVAGEAASSSLNTRCTYAINFLKWINIRLLHSLYFSPLRPFYIRT